MTLSKLFYSLLTNYSLPSYGDVVAAEKNSNLKGGTNLLGDEYTKKER